MGVLDSDLITRLVRATNDSKPEKNEGVLYGTVIDDGGRKYVHLDGSDSSINTPVVTTTDISAGDTVLVQLKNHTATVTGNLTDTAIGKKRADGIESSITQTADQIRLEVNNIAAGLNSSITQTAAAIRSEVTAEVTTLGGQISSLDSKITQTAAGIETLVTNQNEFSQFKQTVEGFSFMGAGGTTKISGGDIQLTGSITWADLASDAQGKVNTANTNASNAVTTANGASSTANTALSTANTANTTANTANTTANNASSTASSAWTKANSAETVANEAKNIANNMSLPSYLKSTYIDSTTIMSPSIFGGKFYAVGQDAFMEMSSDGLRMYTDDISTPKVEITNSGSYINLVLGSGDRYGNNRLHIEKTTSAASILYQTTNGDLVGFLLSDDGKIHRYGTIVAA